MLLVLHGFVVDGDADAGAGEHLTAFQAHRRRHGLLDPAGHPGGIATVPNLREQDTELVATYAGRYVPRPDRILDPSRNLNEELVAGPMAQAVVHHLEPVQVQIEDGEDGVRRPGHPGEGPTEKVHVEGPVRKPRQVVVEGLPGQLLLQSLPGGGVGQGPHDPIRVALGIPLSNAPAENPEVIPVLLSDSMFAVEGLRSVLPVGGQICLYLSQIVGMDPVQPGPGIGPHLPFLQTQHGLPTGRVVDLAGLEIPVPEPVLRPTQGQGVPLLALRQGLLGPFPLSDVLTGRHQRYWIAFGITDHVGEEPYWEDLPSLTGVARIPRPPLHGLDLFEREGLGSSRRSEDADVLSPQLLPGVPVQFGVGGVGVEDHPLQIRDGNPQLHGLQGLLEAEFLAYQTDLLPDIPNQ